MEIVVKQNEERILALFNDEPYLDIDNSNPKLRVIDFCLGKNLKEAGEICLKIIQSL